MVQRRGSEGRSLDELRSVPATALWFDPSQMMHPRALADWLFERKVEEGISPNLVTAARSGPGRIQWHGRSERDTAESLSPHRLTPGEGGCRQRASEGALKMAKRFLQSIGVAVVLVALALVLELGRLAVVGQAPAPAASSRQRRPAPRRRRHGARRTCRASGTTPTKSRCSGRPVMATRSSSPTKNGPSWTSSGRRS